MELEGCSTAVACLWPQEADPCTGQRFRLSDALSTDSAAASVTASHGPADNTGVCLHQAALLSVSKDMEQMCGVDRSLPFVF